MLHQILITKTERPKKTLQRWSEEAGFPVRGQRLLEATNLHQIFCLIQRGNSLRIEGNLVLTNKNAPPVQRGSHLRERLLGKCDNGFVQQIFLSLEFFSLTQTDFERERCKDFVITRIFKHICF